MNKLKGYQLFLNMFNEDGSNYIYDWSSEEYLKYLEETYYGWDWNLLHNQNYINLDYYSLEKSSCYFSLACAIK